MTSPPRAVACEFQSPIHEHCPGPMAQWSGSASENDFSPVVRSDYTIPIASLMQVSPFDEYQIFDTIALHPHLT